MMKCGNCYWYRPLTEDQKLVRLGRDNAQLHVGTCHLNPVCVTVNATHFCSHFRPTHREDD